jgi:hypothetical protein
MSLAEGALDTLGTYSPLGNQKILLVGIGLDGGGQVFSSFFVRGECHNTFDFMPKYHPKYHPAVI